MELMPFFFGSDFVSITKNDDLEWQVLKPLILSQIMQHYMSNEKVIDEVKEVAPTEVNEEDKDIAIQIEELLDAQAYQELIGE